MELHISCWRLPAEVGTKEKIHTHNLFVWFEINASVAFSKFIFTSKTINTMSWCTSPAAESEITASLLRFFFCWLKSFEIAALMALQSRTCASVRTQHGRRARPWLRGNVSVHRWYFSFSLFSKWTKDPFFMLRSDLQYLILLCSSVNANVLVCDPFTI